MPGPGFPRPLVMLLAVALVMTACGDSDDGETGSDTGSTASTTTSAAEPDATTEPEPTTTSTASPTTASEESGTTETTTEASGDSDDRIHLVIDRYSLLGGWDGERWVDLFALEAAEVDATSGDEFQVLTLDGPAGTTTAEGVDLVCEPVGSYGIPTTPPLAADEDVRAFGLRADWDAQPRTPLETEEPDDVYFDVVNEFIDVRGWEKSPVLTQWLRIDLEGDGVDEVFMVAESDFFDSFAYGGPGDYSVALMRKVIDGDVQTAVLGQSYVDPDAEEFTEILTRYEIGAFADLNGDGAMEIIVNDSYYEGAGAVVWEYVDNDLGPVPVLDGGCGA